jgi:serine/threonine-protein kinase
MSDFGPVQAPCVGTTIAGKYWLEAPIGRGGMGSVWRARHLQLERSVALKLMLPSLAGSDARGRFEREAKAAAMISSAHVVHVYDYGVDAGRPFIAMELVEGEDLLTRIRRVGSMSLAETARIVDQICRGLERAHDKGLIHRDLKPGNVVLSRCDGDSVKILDFGVVKASGTHDGDRDLSVGDALVGSPQYMSPEQIRGGNVDTKSDLWAVGVIAYRLLTGRMPYGGESVGEVLMRISADQLVRVSQLCHDAPRAVDAFFERALSRNPARRYATARELAEALNAVAHSAANCRANTPAPRAAGARIKTVRLPIEATEADEPERSPTQVQMIVSQLPPAPPARERLGRVGEVVLKSVFAVGAIAAIGYYAMHPRATRAALEVEQPSQAVSVPVASSDATVAVSAAPPPANEPPAPPKPPASAVSVTPEASKPPAAATLPATPARLPRPLARRVDPLGY